MLDRPFPKVDLAVEIGCGWGFSLAALGKSYQEHPLLKDAKLCGFDLNPAILVIAKRLFQDLHLEGIELAVADVQESLPLAPKSVDFLFASCVVEHLLAQDTSMDNFADVLSAESVLYFSVPNRYMIHPEPHFNVRFVGFVPRNFQKKYVGWSLGIPAHDVETIFSYTPRDLAAVLCPHFPQDLIAVLPVHVASNKRLARVLARLCKRLWVNYHHCVVYRTLDTTVARQLRGKLQQSSVVGCGPLKRAKILKAKRGKSRVAQWEQSPLASSGRRAKLVDFAMVTAGSRILEHSQQCPPPNNFVVMITPLGAGEEAAIHYAAAPSPLEQGEESWCIIDLGCSRDIEAIEIAWFAESEVGVEFLLEAKQDGQWMEQFHETRGDQRVHKGTYWRRLPTAVTARYFRYRQRHALGQNRLLIRRFCLLGRAV